MIIYNLENDSSVKMELYLDINANNNWNKISKVEDNGKWYVILLTESFTV